MKNNIDLLLRRKPALMLMALRKLSPKKYSSKLARETGYTCSHTLKILKNFEEEGYLIFERDGRKKSITLTGRGEILADNSLEIISLIS